eukprot:CAMPEP_0116987726 /NCGR_PEP_ID=MMETSP0467-20121206/63688_1 /TAXON_ID=283647 /ORGANISM="Mesodinium pulex, Strain SPMC105" /LENGTH=50 /DNA_ID=CAMNT_0004683621 /DNA_START=81 /DNA_END=233 /DNA_ORIENTATION=-
MVVYFGVGAAWWLCAGILSLVFVRNFVREQEAKGGVSDAEAKRGASDTAA